MQFAFIEILKFFTRNFGFQNNFSSIMQVQNRPKCHYREFQMAHLTREKSVQYFKVTLITLLLQVLRCTPLLVTFSFGKIIQTIFSRDLQSRNCIMYAFLLKDAKSIIQFYVSLLRWSVPSYQSNQNQNDRLSVLQQNIIDILMMTNSFSI